MTGGGAGQVIFGGSVGSGVGVGAGFEDFAQPARIDVARIELKTARR